MCLQCRRLWFDSWIGKIRWRRDRLHTSVFLGFPCGSAGKEYACSAGDLGLIPGLGRSPGEGKGYALQYSGLENSIDCSPWGCKESDMTEQLSCSCSITSTYLGTSFLYQPVGRGHWEHHILLAFLFLLYSSILAHSRHLIKYP